MTKILTIIPARLASTRLPNKPLADIFGQSMIQRVYNQAKKANLGEVIVACDSKEIADNISQIGGKFIITDPNLPSGTDRIFAAWQQMANKDDYDIIINVQGDLPAIEPEAIRQAAEAAIKSNADIATVASIIKDKAEIADENVVKIALALEDGEDDLGQALYFSRAAIPHKAEQHYHHIGIYAYKAKSLQQFVNLKPSRLENIEKLEQLRALENKMTIAVKIVNSHPLSVDNQADLDNIKDFLKADN